MSTQAFDPTLLQPGDEVGIERHRDGEWVPWSAGRVVAVDIVDGYIDLEGDEWYWLDAENQAIQSFQAIRLRLTPPTDEGRWASLQETVATDLDVLADQTRSMDMPALRRLKAWIDAKGWDA